MLDGLAIDQKVIHSHGKQQVLVKAKGYIYDCEQLLGLWLDLLLVKQLLDLLLGYQCLFLCIRPIGMLFPCMYKGESIPFTPKHKINNHQYKRAILTVLFLFIS